MNIYEFAMQMEKDGEQFYRQMADQTENPGLAGILTMLADEEVRHYNVLLQMQSSTPELQDSGILNEAKNVFVQMKNNAQPLNLEGTDTQIYRQAQELENKGRDFYLEKAQQADNPAQQELLNNMAAEEQKHYLLLENIINFISRPAAWLENAEWSNLENI